MLKIIFELFNLLCALAQGSDFQWRIQRWSSSGEIRIRTWASHAPTRWVGARDAQVRIWQTKFSLTVKPSELSKPFKLNHQGSLCVCALPMGDGVTVERHLLGAYTECFLKYIHVYLLWFRNYEIVSSTTGLGTAKYYMRELGRKDAPALWQHEIFKFPFSRK